MNILVDIDLTPFTKTSSKWIADLSVKCKTIKLLENNIEENIDDLGIGDDSSDTNQRHNPIKKKN